MQALASNHSVAYGQAASPLNPLRRKSGALGEDRQVLGRAEMIACGMPEDATAQVPPLTGPRA